MCVLRHFPCIICRLSTNDDWRDEVSNTDKWGTTRNPRKPREFQYKTMHRISETSVYYILHWKNIYCGQHTAKQKVKLLKFWLTFMLKWAEKMVNCTADPPWLALGLFCRDCPKNEVWHYQWSRFLFIQRNVQGSFDKHQKNWKGTTQHKDIISDADMETLS